MNSALDPLFNSLKIKYGLLDDIFRKNDITIKSKDVNIFIDLDSLFRSIFNPMVGEIIYTGNDNDYKHHVKNMISNILNLASHYRRYFTKMKIYSRIYLLSSHPFNDLKGCNNFYVPGYRKKFNSKLREPNFTLLLKVLIESLDMLRLIVDCIDDLFLITSSSLETAIIPKVINDMIDPNTNDNIIITKDNYYYQYACSDNYYILRPRFNDESYLIKKSTLIDTVKREANVKTEIMVSSSFYTFIKTILGDRNRSIPKISGIGVAKILKILRESIDNNYISSICNDIYGLSRLVDKKHQENLLNNYSVTDIEYQVKCIGLADKNIIKTQLVNKFDNLSLKELNDDLFKNHPINIMDLMGHVKLRHVKKHPFNGNVFKMR